MCHVSCALAQAASDLTTTLRVSRLVLLEDGTESHQGIVVSDFAPSCTVFVSAQCEMPLPSSLTACSVATQPAVGAPGNLIWTLTGALQSGASGSVLFRVTLQ